MNDPRFRILLVEDDPNDARLIEILLGSSSVARFDVEHVSRLGSARTRLSDDVYDLVLLDLSLPDSHGLETFESLYQSAPDIPIVVLSGTQDEQTALRAVQEGAQDYLVKSQDQDEVMVRAIQYSIQRFRAGQQLRQREEHLRLLTDQLPCVFWTTDTRLNFTSFAGADLADLPSRPNRAGRTSLVEYFNDQRSGPVVIRAHLRAAEGEPTTFDLQWNERIYHVHVEPFRQRDGRLVGTIGVALDVTDQKLLDLELRVTRQVQAGLSPSSSPQLAGFDIAGESLSAAEAGGDYYDYFQMKDGSLGIVVCDVAGHGLGPAMMMCQTRAYLRALALSHDRPGEVLELVNRFLCQDTKEERLVALFFARLDPRQRILRYANAGHRGFLLAATGETRLLGPTAIPLNVLEDAPMQEDASLELATGEIVLLYTDGVIERVGADRSQFGIERMLEYVRTHRDESSQDIVSGLFRDVSSFAPKTPQEDDMTAVIIKAL